MELKLESKLWRDKKKKVYFRVINPPSTIDIHQMTHSGHLIGRNTIMYWLNQYWLYIAWIMLPSSNKQL